MDDLIALGWLKDGWVTSHGGQFYMSVPQFRIGSPVDVAAVLKVKDSMYPEEAYRWCAYVVGPIDDSQM